MSIKNNEEQNKIKKAIINKHGYYHKNNNINHERNMTNLHLNNNIYENQDISKEIKDLRERENMMNNLKNNIKNYKSKFRTVSEKRTREYYFSEPNLDINKILNKENIMTDYNKRDNNDNFLLSSKNSDEKKEIIDNGSNYFIEDYKEDINKDDNNENNYLNDNFFTNHSGFKNIINLDNISEIKIQNDNSTNNNENRIGKNQRKINNNNKDIKNNFLFNNNENYFHKINNQSNLLKVENVNLKAKNRILKVSLEKKDKIILALNKKIKDLEEYIENNNNKDEYKIQEKMKNKINGLKIEKNILLNKNKSLIVGIESLNERIKKINKNIEEQNKIFKSHQYDYKKKLSEYRKKIILLKKRVNELYSKDLFNHNKTFNNNNDIYSKKTKLRYGNNYFNKKNLNINRDYIERSKKYNHQRYNTSIEIFRNYLENI